MSDEVEADPDVLSLDEVYADIVGTHEVAQALGVPKTRLNRWIERRASTGCPKPLRELKCGNIYSLTDWRGWYALWKVTRGSESWTVRPGRP